MAKSKPIAFPEVAEPTPTPTPAKDQKSAVHVLASTLGVGVDTAAQMLAQVTELDQAKMVAIYYNPFTDKATEIRKLLDAQK